MNQVSFYGGESTGSVGKITTNQIRRAAQYPAIQSGEYQNTAFRGDYGYEEKKSSSLLGKLVTIAACTAIVIGGLGYAHKADYIGKMKDGKLKDFLKKTDGITKACHDLCSKVKGYSTDCYNKVKSIFRKSR